MCVSTDVNMHIKKHAFFSDFTFQQCFVYYVYKIFNRFMPLVTQ